jgi:hypothetical protein
MVSRRSLLAGATGLGAAGLAAAAGAEAWAGDAVPAPADQPRIPRTLARRRTGIASRTTTAAADFPLTHLSVLTAGAAAVRLRTGSRWGDWLELDSCANRADGGPVTRRRRSLVLARDVTGYEIHTKDGNPATVTELNTIDGPLGQVAGATTDRLPPETGRRGAAARRKRHDCFVPAYLSRTAWGADESLRFDSAGVEKWPVEYYPAQVLTVHHTGVLAHNDDPDPAATVRAVYYDDCVSDDYGDLGYQLLIDEAGRVYEGRVSGTDGLPVFGPQPTADGTVTTTNGAHVGQFNAGNIGVCLLGLFTDRQPTAAARESLVKVLALLSHVVGLDPTGEVNYVNPVNQRGGVVPAILGHGDWARVGADATECPGKAFHPTLPSVREDVAALMR